MKDWKNLEPDKYALVGPHRFSRGRSRPIDRIVIHHNAGVNNTTEYIRDLWNNEREASAHYQVEADGTIGQLVNDFDTAWHAANADINARSIGIEHANISGPPRWQISDATIENGAHLVAALCHGYNLGRPVWGKNVFPHSAYTSTSCPHQLDVGGEDHDTYMRRAQYWYDQMASGSTAVTTTPAPPAQKGPLMALTDGEQRELLDKTREIHHELTYRFASRYPGSDYRDTLVGYVLNIDARTHDIFANMLPAIWNRITAPFKEKK